MVAVIPLRAGSKRLPGKNLRPLLGKPLFSHTIQHARSAGISRIVVSTDISELFNADLGDDVRIVERPKNLADDDTPMNRVLEQVLTEEVTDNASIVLLQATSPLRDPQDISKAINLFSEGRHDIVLTVTPADRGILKWGISDGDRFMPVSNPRFCFSNRHQLPDVYRPDGGVYVFNADWFRREKTFERGVIGFIETPLQRAYDIDTLEDFELVERALKQV